MTAGGFLYVFMTSTQLKSEVWLRKSVVIQGV